LLGVGGFGRAKKGTRHVKEQAFDGKLMAIGGSKIKIRRERG